MSTFGVRLQALRESKKPVICRSITSELIGLHRDALRRYERGEQEPKRPALILIADYYGISLDELCRDDEPQKQ